ncbi:MAG: peptidoglycan recognition protein family protein, partial [Acetatifactor sp.]|nr:peptidoglycan recognition protein family protein [Acetatifactor sp.]
ASRSAYGQDMRQPVRKTGELQPISGQNMRQRTGRPGAQGGRPSREAMLRARRKRQVRRQRIAVGIWAICIIAICGVLFLNRNSASAAEPGTAPKNTQQQYQEGAPANVSGAVIQGLPLEKFTAHPEWTENFLTINEYSRPGEALPEVKDIFVHYTANLGTSAAQNRSYFERQKDEHKASVSAHFIIGYEGEIIQCVPLDEIAYAVVGRNYDSVSIECCYTAKDGSFTQETYDSLISLLAWLTDVYDLDTNHILRHYDSNGKKCPVYYAEHEDEWEQLKQDVKAYK